MRLFAIMFILSLGLVSSCTSTIQDAYFDMWESIGIEKRDILVDRVEDAQETQQEAQEQFSSALTCV